MSDPAAELLLVVEGFHDLVVIRYLSAAGLVILLYDHLLSFADEVRLIWSAKFTSSKLLFLVMRYLVVAIMIAETVQFSGLSNISLSNASCQVWLTFTVLVGWITIALNNWFVLLRLWVLWDRNRKFIITTLVFFIAVQVATLALAWIAVGRMIPTLYFVPFLHVCGFSTPSKLGLVWIPGLLFEFVMLMALGWKVGARPQTLKTLHDDGFEYFFFLFVLTLANTVVFLVGPTARMFSVLFFMWCFTTTTTCRMILGLRRSAERARLRYEGSDDVASSDDTHEHSEYRPPTQFIELARLPCETP